VNALKRTTKPIPAALGFRVKSGWAMSALLTGSANAPKLIQCRAVLLSDPKIPQSKQPHHAALELPASEAKTVTRKLRKVVTDAAKKSVRELLNEASELQYEVLGAGLVVGSLVDPATLHNEHIRAHGLEGQLFRTALEDALRKHEVSCNVLLEKTAYTTASPALRKSKEETKKWIADMVRRTKVPGGRKKSLRPWRRGWRFAQKTRKRVEAPMGRNLAELSAR
jgi:hypothetical protein